MLKRYKDPRSTAGEGRLGLKKVAEGDRISSNLEIRITMGARHSYYQGVERLRARAQRIMAGEGRGNALEKNTIGSGRGLIDNVHLLRRNLRYEGEIRKGTEDLFPYDRGGANLSERSALNAGRRYKGAFSVNVEKKRRGKSSFDSTSAKAAFPVTKGAKKAPSRTGDGQRKGERRGERKNGVVPR